MKYINLDHVVELDFGEILTYYDDDELIDEVESRGYTAIPDEDIEAGSRRTPNQNLHEELCDKFSITRYSTKQELLKHIHSLL